MLFKSRNNLAWMLPGLYIKRWLGSALIGVALIMIGLALLLNLHPIAATIDVIKKTAPAIPSWQSGTGILIIGLILAFIGWRKTTNTMIEAVTSRDIRQGDILDHFIEKIIYSKVLKLLPLGVERAYLHY